MTKRYLVLGSGGREHALCWHLKKSGHEVEAAPGSDAIAEMIAVWDFKDFEDLKQKAKSRGITEIIVGPEKYLAEGIADFFEGEEIAVFGPSKEAAQLETDKAWAKEFLARHQIPTAGSVTVSNEAEIEAALEKFQPPFVVKAAGLAAGKGVWIGDEVHEAKAFAKEALASHPSVVIEEFLDGEEVSFFTMVDGENFVVLGSAQDHKRLLENDRGPNTGGMGSYGPLPWVDKSLYQRILDQAVVPTLRGLKADGFHYRGFIFFGFMVKDGTPYVLEYNCRMGDPETQSLLLRVKTPLPQILEALTSSEADPEMVEHKPGISMNIVLAAKGYPSQPLKGFSLEGVDRVPADTVLFHAGTRKEKDVYFANGGRLVSICTLQPSLQECQNLLYPWIEKLSFLDKIAYRRDIGMKAYRFLKPAKTERTDHAEHPSL